MEENKKKDRIIIVLIFIIIIMGINTIRMTVENNYLYKVMSKYTMFNIYTVPDTRKDTIKAPVPMFIPLELPYEDYDLE